MAATSVSAPTSSGEGPSGSSSASASTGSVHCRGITRADEQLGLSVPIARAAAGISPAARKDAIASSSASAASA